MVPEASHEGFWRNSRYSRTKWRIYYAGIRSKINIYQIVLHRQELLSEGQRKRRRIKESHSLVLSFQPFSSEHLLPRMRMRILLLQSHTRREGCAAQSSPIRAGNPPVVMVGCQRCDPGYLRTGLLVRCPGLDGVRG